MSDCICCNPPIHDRGPCRACGEPLEAHGSHIHDCPPEPGGRYIGACVACETLRAAIQEALGLLHDGVSGDQPMVEAAETLTRAARVAGSEVLLCSNCLTALLVPAGAVTFTPAVDRYGCEGQSADQPCLQCGAMLWRAP